MKMSLYFTFPSFKIFLKGKICFLLIRVACPKFGNPILSSECYNYALNIRFVAAVDMLRKRYNHHSKAGKLKTDISLTNSAKPFFPFKK